MENEKCKIEFDSITNTYHSGQTIHGKISLICVKKKKIRGVYFKITGYGKCSWSTLIRRDSAIQSPNTSGIESAKNDRREHAIQYAGNEDYLLDIVYLTGSKNGPSFELPEGTTTYPFSYQLRRTLPSTFRGSYGKIKYKIEFVVDKPWNFDEQYVVPLIIYKSFNLNLHPMYMTVPQQKQIARNIGYFGSGPITLFIYIPRSGYVPGEKLPLQVTVKNNSSTHVDKVKFSVRKIINYFSITPVTMQKQEIVKILKKEAGGVEKKSEQKYEHMLLIPELPATDEQASKIIHIKYEIKVEVKLSGLYKNIIETIPLIIGSNQNNLSSVSGDGSTIPMTIIQQARSPQPPPIGFVRDDIRRLSISSSHTSAASSSFASAPPLDFSSISPNSTRSSVYSSHWDAPPSYEDVFGSPSSSSRYSAYSSLNSSLRISTTESTSNRRRTSQNIDTSQPEMILAHMVTASSDTLREIPDTQEHCQPRMAHLVTASSDPVREIPDAEQDIYPGMTHLVTVSSGTIRDIPNT